jgi:hypothetical protein
VPQGTKNHVSVHRLAVDNNVFLEFHPWFFFIKDCATRKLLLKGRCRNGLYPLPASLARQAFGVNKPSFHRWHSRLGHPVIPIVQKIISLFNLTCLSESNKGSVCNACQQAKSHQLSYPKSFSISSHHLELVYQMYRVMHLNLLDVLNIMSVLLMILASLPGFISLSTSLRSSKNSKSFKLLLSVSLIARSSPCRLTGVVSMRNSIPFSQR